LVEALCFTSGVRNRSNDRVTFKKIHNTCFIIARTRHSSAQRRESDVVCDRAALRGYRFVDTVRCQDSLRMMPGGRDIRRGKQGMTGVDLIATMRQHAADLAN
jgi:hypothetical protein